MPETASSPCLNIDPEELRRSIDREPFGFTHNLSGLDLFEMGSLRALSAKYRCEDYYVAGGAPEPGSKFYSVAHNQCGPVEALERLGSESYRVLLKRPEKYDPRFRELLDTLFEQVIDMRGGLGEERVVRKESAILISSAATTTPFHFDPEINFFSQIEGEKIYHVYSPASLTEAELERFYIRGAVNIGQVDLASRDPSYEHVFALGPGKGLHQPQNAPHWVETRGSRSISFPFVFETNVTRARGRVRAFNFCLRKLGLNPAQPGAHPALEVVKAGTMDVVIPTGKKVRNTLLKALGR
jgi:hypothetical protein